MELSNAPHPGVVLRDEFLGRLGLSLEQLSRATEIPREVLEGIVSGEHDVDLEAALRLATHLGTTADFWLKLQSAYDQAAKDQQTPPGVQ